MNMLTIIILAILAAAALIGWRKGLLRMLFSLGTLIIALILTMLLSSQIEKILSVNTGLTDYINSKYNSYMNTREDDAYIRSLTENFKEENDTVTLKSVLSAVKNRESAQETTENVLNAVTDEAKLILSSKLTQMTIKVIVFILTWIVISLIIRMLLRLIKIIEKLPVIHGINKFAGLGIGLLAGILIVWIFFAVITVTAASSFGSICMKQIADSEILSILYRSNIILKILK